MADVSGAYIGGSWRPFTTGTPTAIRNPATESVVGTLWGAGDGDVDDAVRHAGEAFAAWSQTSCQQRARLLRELATELEKREAQIAETITRDVGMPLRHAARIQARLPVTVTSSYANLIESLDLVERIGNSLVVREPVGVVAAVTPWNYPLHQIICKVAPALAAGATVVLKPSEVAPLVTQHLVEALEAAAAPPGLVNIVHGIGPDVGPVLVNHPGVDMVSFTGSVPTGIRVAEWCARGIKRVSLELGGKSASVVLPDADLARAVKATVANAFLNSGQTCSAWSRLLVPHEQHEQALEIARAAAGLFAPGDPMDASTRLGPLVSASQRARVRSFIDRGRAEGARLVTGGSEPPTAVGYFVSPTVFGDVQPHMAIAQEEIFGPVLAVMPYRDVEDAIRIANGTRYGLHGGVWSADQDLALRVAGRLRTGSVDVNGAAFNPLAPFGGVKQSGTGRELGRHGLVEFTELKSIQF